MHLVGPTSLLTDGELLDIWPVTCYDSRIT